MRHFLIAAMLMLPVAASAEEDNGAAAARAIETLFPDYVIMKEAELDAGMVKYLRQGSSYDYGPLTRVTADFDGNGLDDHAVFLRAREGSGGGPVIVFQTSEGQFRTVHNLLISNWLEQDPRFITRVEAGEEIKPYEPINGPMKTFVLRNPAIEYVVFQTAVALLYWNSETEKFEAIWSD